MMQAHEILLNYAGKLMKLPFKGVLITLGTTFTLAIVGSLLLYRVVFPDVAQEMPRGQQGGVFIAKENPTLHSNEIKDIVSRNIFNKTGEIPKEDMRDEKAAYKGAEAIKSELPLKLNGLIYAGNPSSGLALIQNTDTQKQSSFLVGDFILKDVVLIEVQESKVIMQVHDHKEFLDLLDPVAPRAKRIRKQGAIGTAVVSGSKYSEEGFERDGNRISMSADYRQKLLTTDFAKVLQDAKAEPVYEGSELNGFRLTRIRPDSVYEKGGLQNDDIVKEINGVSLVDTAQAIKLLNSLRGAGEIEIGVVRGGKKLNVNIQVK